MGDPVVNSGEDGTIARFHSVGRGFGVCLLLSAGLLIARCGETGRPAAIDLDLRFPLRGTIQSQLREGYLAIVLDSDSDPRGIDGLADLVFLAGNLAATPEGLPEGSVEKAEVRFDPKSGLLEVFQGRSLVLRLRVSAAQDTGLDDSGAFLVQAISYVVEDRSGDLRAELTRLLEFRSRLFGDLEVYNCPVGGVGAVDCECRNAITRAGAVCAEPAWSCCDCDAAFPANCLR